MNVVAKMVDAEVYAVATDVRGMVRIADLDERTMSEPVALIGLPKHTHAEWVPINDQAALQRIALNCGTGAGGFKVGNTCAKGDPDDDLVTLTPKVGRVIDKTRASYADAVITSAEDIGENQRVVTLLSDDRKTGYFVLRDGPNRITITTWRDVPGKLPANVGKVEFTEDVAARAVDYLESKGPGLLLTQAEWFDHFLTPSKAAVKSNTAVVDAVNFYRKNWMASPVSFEKHVGVPLPPPELVDQVEAWAKTVTAEEDRALARWFGSAYADIHAAERSGKVTFDSYAGQFKDAVSRAPVWTGDAYRGKPVYPAKINQYRAMYQPGRVFESNKSESWTRSQAVADRFAKRDNPPVGGVLVRMTVASKTGRYVAPASTHGEEEIIMPRGRRYRVKSFAERRRKNDWGVEWDEWDVTLEEIT
jgi:hypothetical protein